VSAGATEARAEPPSRASANDLFLSPSLYPCRLRLRPDRIEFVPMTREGYRAANFLGPDLAERSSGVVTLALDELRQLRARAAGPARRCALIFHTAFCGSTLLSRCLEALDALVLKEPHILVDVCVVRQALRQGEGWRARASDFVMSLASRTVGSGQHRPMRWAASLEELVLDLTSRSFEPGQTVVAKLNDACNASMPELAGPRSLFLHSSLPDFVASVCKSPERRQWIRQRTTAAGALIERCGYTAPASGGDPDAFAAASQWLTYLALFEACVRASGARAPASLSTAELLADPAVVLQRVCRHLGCPATAQEIERSLASETQRHAKRPRLIFDPAARRLEQASLQRELRREIDGAVRWASRFRELDGPLPNRLS
jgi:hypothetical protein